MHDLNNTKTILHRERGIALLVTLLVITVLLGIGASIVNITLKQYQFASIGLASEIAFQAANAGIECVLAHDYETFPRTAGNPGKFGVGETSPDITCMGVPDTGSAGTIESGEAQTYTFNWHAPDAPEVCTDVTIYKFYSSSGPVDMLSALGRTGTCAVNTECTVIRSRGYNVPCPASGQNFPPRSIEREITQRY
jgi:hypothetical protein